MSSVITQRRALQKCLTTIHLVRRAGCSESGFNVWKDRRLVRKQIRQTNKGLYQGSIVAHMHTTWQTVSIQLEIEVKHKVLFSVRDWAQCTCLLPSTNKPPNKLGLLCMCVFVCVRACASVFAWGEGRNTYQIVPSQNVFTHKFPPSG